MPFSGYLPTSELQELVLAAVDSGLPDLVHRSLLVQGIPGPFASAGPRDPNPLMQFNLDLNRFNNVERLENGVVPLVQFLRNAAFQLKLLRLPQAAVFEKYANVEGNRAFGVPSLPDPRTLPEITVNQAIIGADDMLDFSFLKMGAAAGRSVARIKVPRFERGVQVMNGGAPWIMVGTAWIVGPGLVLTNRHVINARRDDEPPASDADLVLQGLNSSLEFDLDSKENEAVVAGVEKLIAYDSGLDYALLQLAEDPTRHPLRLAQKALTFDATSYIAVNIIQHPRGEPKRVAIRNNLVSGADAQILRYFTDTDFGSSGSPVCDDQWQVVALHRGAKHVDGVQYQGRSSAFVNFGSQISAVLDDVNLKDSAAFCKILAAQRSAAVR